MLEGISKSKRFQLYAVSFLFSVAISSVYNIPINIFGLVFCLIILSWGILIFKKSLITKYILISLIFFILGFVRINIFELPKYKNINLQNKFIAQVVREPDVRQDGVRYILKSENQGRYYIKSNLYPRYNYGDILNVSCKKFVDPEPIEDFRYDKFLARLQIYKVCVSPRLYLDKNLNNKLNKKNILLSGVYFAKQKVAARVNKIWHEPYASFMAGLLYGYRGGLGTLNHDFSVTGVTHIVAISGYNITVLVSIIQPLLISLRIGRKRGFYIVIIFIILFTIFAGLSASVVRAAIMGVIVLLAKHLGRKSSIFNTLLLSAVVMTIQNPYVLMWDAGFQLSFLSTVGLIYLNPHFDKALSWMPEFLSIRESAQTTFSATLVTLPLILFQFKKISIVAIPTNLLVLWIIPFIMFCGFITLALSIILPQVALLFSYVSWLMMGYIVFIVRILAKLDFASYDASISMFTMYIIYAIMFGYVFYKSNKKITPLVILSAVEESPE